MNMNLTLNLTLLINNKYIINECNFVMFKGGSRDSDLGLSESLHGQYNNVVSTTFLY